MPFERSATWSAAISGSGPPAARAGDAAKATAAKAAAAATIATRRPTGPDDLGTGRGAPAFLYKSPTMRRPGRVVSSRTCGSGGVAPPPDLARLIDPRQHARRGDGGLWCAAPMTRNDRTQRRRLYLIGAIVVAALAILLAVVVLGGGDEDERS